jgi:hypothetical protein
MIEICSNSRRAFSRDLQRIGRSRQAVSRAKRNTDIAAQQSGIESLRQRLSNARPFPVAVILQVVAGVIAFGGAHLMAQGLGLAVPRLAVLLAQGGMAALASHLVGLGWWWLPIQLLLPPAVLLVGDLGLPSWLPLVLFVLLALVFWNSARDRVPLYLTNRATAAAVAELLPPESGVRVIDLGCGLGGLAARLARARPDAAVTGVESAPFPFAIGWLYHRLVGPANLDIRYGNMWRIDLGQWDVIYCFLSPAPMARLYDKIKSERPTGGLFISNSFAVPEAPADRVVTVDDRRQSRLLVWSI